MADYSQRTGRPLGGSAKAMGGAALNLPIGCLEGEGDMIYTFDDFNGFMVGEEFSGSAEFEPSGWELTDINTTTASLISINNVKLATHDYNSCLRIFPGTDEDSGGVASLDMFTGDIASSVSNTLFPHMWIPETAALPTTSGVAGEVLDNTTWVFACRIGLRADETTTGSGAWDGKVFIGWAPAGDISIMTRTDGVLTINSTGELVGFHVTEEGNIRGISHRTLATAMAEGTNFTALLTDGAVDGTTANGAAVAGDTMWFDLALRMDITDMSDDAANGSTTFYHRGPLNTVAPQNAGKDEFANPGEGYLPWIDHGTVLTNQTPNNPVALTPVIEAISGPVAGVDCIFLLDWWVFGRSRPSRSIR